MTDLTSLLDAIDGDFDKMREQYEHLHRNPEIGLAEHDTAEFIEQALSDAGLDTQRIGGTGVVALIENGDGPTVLGRADMDALSVKEDTGLDYASQRQGFMHACGHDTHMAGLLAAVRALVQHRDAWSGTYIALFQPSEENAAGAKAMVDDDLTGKVPAPDVALGCHAMVGPAGAVMSRPGPSMSSADTIQVTVYGRGAHGSMPHLSVDPVVLASSIVMRLQTIVSREIEPGAFAVVTVGSLQAGATANIIADRAELRLNVRTYDEHIRDQVLAAIERIVRAECEAAGSPRGPEIEHLDHFPVTDNDESLFTEIRAGFDSAFGDESIDMQRVTASEDFSVIPDAFGVPYLYWFVGSTDRDTYREAVENGTVSQLPSNHSPYFAPVVQPTLTSIAQSHLVAAAIAFDRNS